MGPFGDGHGVGACVVIGHRGAPRVEAENTPASFAAAVASGATWVELDVRCSADGVAVVHHDATTVDGRAVMAQSAHELSTRGIWTLAGVLEGLPASLGVDIEVKTQRGRSPDKLVAAVGEVIAARDGERPFLTSSFDVATILALREASPSVPTGYLHSGWPHLSVALARALSADAAVLCSHLRTRGLNKAGIAAAHAAGLAVMVWCVDDPGRAASLAAAGVDALCTNDPATISAALA